MKTEDQCHECKGKAKSVYIDGSSYKLGASNYSGWGLWSPDDQNFNENRLLKGVSQGSDRAEVRALVAALEKAEEYIEIITDDMSETLRNILQQEAKFTKESTVIFIIESNSQND
eukprot:14710846-Heterocapsa_arctica.AAC.1